MLVPHKLVFNELKIAFSIKVSYCFILFFQSDCLYKESIIIIFQKGYIGLNILLLGSISSEVYFLLHHYSSSFIMLSLQSIGRGKK